MTDRRTSRSIAADFEIDDERSDFTVSFRPPVPGFGVRLSGLSGQFTIPLLEDGEPDLDGTAEGEFACGVRGLKLGNPVLTRMGRSWLDDGTDSPIRGSIGESSPLGDGRHQLTLHLTLRGATHPLESVGTIATAGDDLIVAGTTRVRPTDIGFPFPLPVPMVATSDYAIHLARTG